MRETMLGLMKEKRKIKPAEWAKKKIDGQGAACTQAIQKEAEGGLSLLNKQSAVALTALQIQAESRVKFSASSSACFKRVGHKRATKSETSVLGKRGVRSSRVSLYIKQKDAHAKFETVLYGRAFTSPCNRRRTFDSALSGLGINSNSKGLFPSVAVDAFQTNKVSQFAWGFKMI